MSDLLNIYHATMVRRWHTNPYLSHTVDPVGYHSGRMAILALKLWPCNWNIVAACLTHDLGEIASGDIPWNGDKTTADDVADKWSVDHDMDWHLDANALTTRRLKFLDRLDAYLWARHHAPVVLTDTDWRSQYYWLKDEARYLEVDLCLFNM